MSEKQATNKWISDHTPKPKPKKQEQDDRLLIEDGEYTLRGWGKSLVSWDGEKEIDPSDWEDLLFSIGEDVHDFSTGWYDTPFYDGFGTLSGTACINGKCADRSEINYIGEGEALAALGLTKKQTFQVVAIWKHGMYDQAPTSDTFYFTETGWDYYNDHYSTPSHSLPIFQKMITPFIQTGTPMIMPFLLP